MNVKDCMASAALSECGKYRFTLHRWNPHVDTGKAVFILLNPSTADATKNDKTTELCWHFTQAWGFSHEVLVNTNPYRSSDPLKAKQPPEHIMAANDNFIMGEVAGADIVVGAWGAKAHPAHVARILKLLKDVPIYSIATTTRGAPRHPLYQRRDLKPVLWTPSA